MAGELILIVDDDPLNVRLLTDVLELHGYAVVHAASGETSLDVVARATPALVLMDIQLPGMNGIAARAALRERESTREAKFIALTASVMPHEIASFDAVGFDAFHPKPIDMPRLLQQIESLLRGTREGATNTSTPPDKAP
jgi:CheY-like chemotaxis protein